MAFAQDVDLSYKLDWRTTNLFGGTGKSYEHAGLRRVGITLRIGDFWHDMKLFSQAMSASALTIDLWAYSVAGNSAGFRLASARIDEWSVRGGEGDLWQSRASFMCPDVSAYGTGL
jgi:hypothetical protein